MLFLPLERFRQNFLNLSTVGSGGGRRRRRRRSISHPPLPPPPPQLEPFTTLRGGGGGESRCGITSCSNSLPSLAGCVPFLQGEGGERKGSKLFGKHPFPLSPPPSFSPFPSPPLSLAYFSCKNPPFSCVASLSPSFFLSPRFIMNFGSLLLSPTPSCCLELLRNERGREGRGGGG